MKPSDAPESTVHSVSPPATVPIYLFPQKHLVQSDWSVLPQAAEKPRECSANVLHSSPPQQAMPCQPQNMH
ncbi:hypothetical protein Hypma_000334, partial [Hypsizygus marmoreus]